MLEGYRQDYTNFNRALMQEYYLYYSGQKTEFAIAPIYERYGDLFTSDSVATLKRTFEATPEHFETERTALRRLLIFATNQYLDSAVKEMTEELSQYETETKIDWSGGPMTFQDSAIRIATEGDRPTRSAIYDARAKVVEGSNALRAERLSRLHSAARDSGYTSYTALYEALHGRDYSRFAGECEALLARTESVYTARLDEALRRDLGIGIEQAERPDAMYFLHQSHYDGRFPAEGILRVYRETMEGLGISVESQKNILIDAEARPHKSPRAFCAPVCVPDEIRLVIRPFGGQSDYQTFLHEAGHAQHYGGASAGLAPEFKYTGDAALSETYAFLLNYLPADEVWLSRLLGFTDNRDFIRAVMLSKLMAVRRYAAKLIYELRLHSGGDAGGAAAQYSALQTASTKFKTGESDFLYDLDDAFYSADYLRAWAFEVALREYLKKRFGNQWWSNRRAGRFLQEIWETGDRYTADEMASQIGIGPISFDLLMDEFVQMQ
jgi:hypothetical protein